MGRMKYLIGISIKIDIRIFTSTVDLFNDSNMKMRAVKTVKIKSKNQTPLALGQLLILTIFLQSYSG